MIRNSAYAEKHPENPLPIKEEIDTLLISKSLPAIESGNVEEKPLKHKICQESNKRSMIQSMPLIELDHVTAIAPNESISVSLHNRKLRLKLRN